MGFFVVVVVFVFFFNFILLGGGVCLRGREGLNFLFHVNKKETENRKKSHKVKMFEK